MSRRIRKNRRDFMTLGGMLGGQGGSIGGAIAGAFLGRVAHEGLKKLGSYDKTCRKCGNAASPIDELGVKTLYKCTGCGSTFTSRS